jgi:hypothetical protein
MPDNRRVPSPAPPDEPEGRPPAEDGARRQVRITSREALLRVVPILFGFRPEASAVILGTQPPRGTLKISLRYSLEDLAAPDVAAYNIGHVLNVLTSQDSGLAMVIGYGPDAQVAPFVKLFREQAGKHNVRILELLRVKDNRYWVVCLYRSRVLPARGHAVRPRAGSCADRAARRRRTRRTRQPGGAGGPRRLGRRRGRAIHAAGYAEGRSEHPGCRAGT